MTHPFLADPERARAYRILCDHPSGSTRSWAGQTGLTHAQLRGFLAALTKLGIARVESFGKHGSVFRPCETVLDRAISCETVLDRAPADDYSRARADVLDVLDTRSRYALTRGEVVENPEGSKVIEAVNMVLSTRFSDYPPISADNKGSLVAASRWLETIPLADVIRLAQEMARAFNPDKTGGYPRSLGHPLFLRSIPRLWRAEVAQRTQLEIPLLTKLHRPPKSSAAVAEPSPDPCLQRPASAETIDAVMQRMERLRAGSA